MWACIAGSSWALRQTEKLCAKQQHPNLGTNRRAGWNQWRKLNRSQALPSDVVTHVESIHHLSVLQYTSCLIYAHDQSVFIQQKYESTFWFITSIRLTDESVVLLHDLCCSCKLQISAWLCSEAPQQHITNVKSMPASLLSNMFFPTVATASWKILSTHILSAPHT